MCNHTQFVKSQPAQPDFSWAPEVLERSSSPECLGLKLCLCTFILSNLVMEAGVDTMEMSEIAYYPSDKNMSPRPASTTTAKYVGITEVKDDDDSKERLFHPKQDSNPVLSQHVRDNTRIPKASWWERLLLTRYLWRPTWNIYLFWVIGIGFAIGHHAFYASLEGKIVHGDDQLLMLRYGTALAFAAKAGFVASVLTAFREQIWATARSKMLAINTLDDMFAAVETPFSLLNLELLSNGKVVALLALYCW